MDVGDSVTLPRYLGSTRGTIFRVNVDILGVNCHIIEILGGASPRYVGIPVIDLVPETCPTCGQPWPAVDLNAAPTGGLGVTGGRPQ